ncbi:MAG: M20/M25/M40 family metallo-hydrolase [Acidobacteriota bacterium]
MINQERLKQHLLEIVQIDSVSGREGRLAQRLKAELEALGASVEIDAAGEQIGGDTGNVIARLPGTLTAAPPLFLCAHMDTVVPGEGVRPIVEGDIIRTDGTTVLGGDDKSGISVILEVVRTLQERNIPYSPLEIVFTICEEVGLLGAKHLDVSRLRSTYGLVLDSDDVGYLFTKAPATNRMEFRVYGLEAHAGVCPERGISAIQIVADAISTMRLGRIDYETTANIGLIEGGMAINIIPNLVRLKAEARSHSEEKLQAQTQHMINCLEAAATRHRADLEGVSYIGRVEADVHRDYDRMDVPDDARIVQLVKQAARNLGQQVQTLATGGGCDANVLNKKGLTVANLGTGMQQIHTVNEWLDVKEMYKSAAIVLEIVRLNSSS